MKAVIANSHLLTQILNTLRKEGWNFDFLNTIGHKLYFPPLYKQLIDTDRFKQV